MKKFGSNWKKLATNITNVKRQTNNVQESVSPTFNVLSEGKVKVRNEN